MRYSRIYIYGITLYGMGRKNRLTYFLFLKMTVKTIAKRAPRMTREANK